MATERWPALQRGDGIEVFDPNHLERRELGLVLDDTPAGGAPRFLCLGGLTSESAIAMGSICVPMPDQVVRRTIGRDAFKSALLRLAGKLGPLVGRSFPEQWDGVGA